MKLTKKQQEEMLKAQKETAELKAAPDFLKAVEKFSPVFEKLGQRSMSLMLDVREACAEVCKFLKVPPTKEGKKKATLVIRACTSDAGVLTYANRWVAVILANQKGANIGTVSRETSENIWSDVNATPELIETQAELLGASTKANEALGVKKRNPNAKKAESKITVENVFDYLPGIFKTTAGIAKLKEVCAAHGYDLTVAKPKEDFSLADAIQGAAHRKPGLRKAA